MAYKYTAYTSDKKIVEGTIEVASEAIAEATLTRAGYERILSLTETSPGINLEKYIPSFFGVKTSEVIEFSGQLATLIESGITLLTALQLLRQQIPKKSLRKTVAGLIEEIQGGNSLSVALSHYPQVFPDTYTQIIRASEQAGNLESGLRHAGSYLEKQAASSYKIKKALMYPAFIILIAIGVCILMVTVVLPPLMDLFISLDADMPWMTTLLINFTDFVRNNFLMIIAILLILGLLGVVIFRLPEMKLAKDRALLKVPVFGNLIVEKSMHRFCQTSSMLMEAGLRLPQIMEIAIQTSGNRIIRQALNDVRDRLIQGEGLSQPMGQMEVFPSLLVEMIVVGEKTGTLDASLSTMANFYERRVDQRIDSLISMIEPALTLGIGIVVVFIVLSMITPLYSILQSIH